MQSQDIKVVVNNVYEFDGLNIEDLDIIQKSGNGEFHILHNQKSFHAQLVEADFDQKKCSIKINNEIYSIDFNDPLDILVDQLGLAVQSDHTVKEIHAPMPGLVLEIQIEEGDEVHEGQALVILEAMKMENVIKSPGEGKVKNILVSKGAAVEKNALLIEFE